MLNYSHTRPGGSSIHQGDGQSQLSLVRSANTDPCTYRGDTSLTSTDLLLWASDPAGPSPLADAAGGCRHCQSCTAARIAPRTPSTSHGPAG